MVKVFKQGANTSAHTQSRLPITVPRHLIQRLVIQSTLDPVITGSRHLILATYDPVDLWPIREYGHLIQGKFKIERFIVCNFVSYCCRKFVKKENNDNLILN